MMDYFAGIQSAPKILSHYQAMLKHIPILPCHFLKLMGATNHHIPLLRLNIAPSTPARILLSHLCCAALRKILR